VLGWIAEKYPSLVKRISEKHDIGCHSMHHSLVYKQSENDFRQETARSKKLLEDLTGKEVLSYRAPGFSITPQVKWAFRILCEEGFATDCSVFPEKRNHGGFENFGTSDPCRIRIDGMTINEFPMSPFAIGSRRIFFSGGGYFRALPYFLISMMMENSEYVMSYFHPRDFDHDQPVLKTLPVKRKIMSYIGLKSAGRKLIKLLREFHFIDLKTAGRMIDWQQTPVVHF
jgi:polysaccharide deacetylase family protein (PEP-CTERM system associated)